MNKYTLEHILNLLHTSGIGSKTEVLNLLENASIENLRNLSKDILITANKKYFDKIRKEGFDKKPKKEKIILPKETKAKQQKQIRELQEGNICSKCNIKECMNGEWVNCKKHKQELHIRILKCEKAKKYIKENK